VYKDDEELVKAVVAYTIQRVQCFTTLKSNATNSSSKQFILSKELNILSVM